MLRALLLVAAVGGAAAAQTLSVGVHGGVDLARVQTDENLDSTYVTEPVVGASVAVGFGAPLALRLEVEYLRKGGQVTVGGPGGSTADYTLSYLAVPINLRYELSVGSTEAYVFAGTTVGALLAADRRRAGDAESQDIKGDLNGVEVSVDLGFGVGYRLTPAIAVVFDVRYGIGLNQVAKGEAVLAASSWTSRAIQMVLGLTYQFGAAEAAPAIPNYARSP